MPPHRMVTRYYTIINKLPGGVQGCCDPLSFALDLLQALRVEQLGHECKACHRSPDFIKVNLSLNRGHDITNPNNAKLIREIPENYHSFALFDSPQMGDIMTPVETQAF